MRAIQLGTGLLVTATLLVATGCVLVGGHDALLATRPQERLVGAVILLSGLASVAAAILLLRGRTGWALTGFTAGSIAGLLLAAVQASFNFDYRTWLWLLAAALPASVAVMTATRIRHRQGALSDTVLAAVLAATATGLVPLLGLLGGAFRPVSEAEILDAQLDLAVVTQRTDAKAAKYVIVEATLNLENIGKRRLVIFGSNYFFTGTRSIARPLQHQSQWRLADEMKQQQWSGRYEAPPMTTLIESGYDVFTPGNFLDPGQHGVVSFHVIVPVGQINTVDAGFTVGTAFADRLLMGEQSKWAGEQQLTPASPVVSNWKIEPTGWTAALTRGRPILEVAYGVETKDNPELASDPSADPQLLTGASFDYRLGRDTQQLRSTDRFNPRIDTFYGAGWTGASASLAVDSKPN